MNKIPIPAAVRPAKSPVAILGVPFDRVSTTDAVNLIERMIASRRPHYLATANVDFVVQAQSDIELRRILLDAHLVLCDGTPLVWASRTLGSPLPERVAGADLVPQLIQLSAEKGYRIFLLGATPEAARQATEKLRRQFPKLNLVGSYSPPFSPLLEMDHDDITRKVREAKPDLLFVSFGCPKQEKWIAMHYRDLGVPVAIGVGATIDFLAGQVKRAPVWMQRSGTEWIFRLLQEPRRLFKRYAVDLGVFGWRFLHQLAKSCRTSRTPEKAATCTATLRTNGWQHLILPKRFDAAAVRHSAGLLETVMNDHRSCVLEMREVNCLDSAGAGCLMQLRKCLGAQGRSLILLSPTRSVRRILTFMRVLEFFSVAESLQSARCLNDLRTQELARPVTGRNPLVWQGDVTALNAGEVFAATESRLSSQSHAGEFEIDLSRVRFIDSTGIDVMRRIRNLADQLGTRVRFSNATSAVRNVARFCRLEKTLFHPQGTTVPRNAPHRVLVPSQQT